jgi:hypothetical protein
MDETWYQERGFRSGYLRGFEDGIHSLRELQDQGMSLDEAVEKCEQFIRQDLDRWKYGNLDSPEPPPGLKSSSS